MLTLKAGSEPPTSLLVALAASVMARWLMSRLVPE
jgi:hypothetical protein